MSKLMYLEHVNVNVGVVWTEALENFYFNGLGFAKDPRAVAIYNRTKEFDSSSRGLHWANIGLQQIHMPWNEQQRIRGTIGLYYQTLETLAPRLRRLNISFDVTQLSDEVVFDLVCPLGNKFRAHEYAFDNHISLFGPGDLRRSLNPNDNLVTDTTDRYLCEIPGEKSVGVGMGYVDFLVSGTPGTAAAIGEFYRHYFDAETYLTPVIEPDVCAAQQRFQCIVKLGSYQSLRFSEARSDQTVPDYDGHHICIFISEFAEVYQRMESSPYSNLLWINPRFLRTASRNLDEALAQHEFRFKDIINIDTGEAIYEIEHEVRSLGHPSCCIHQK
jgi:hypothetical protein